MHVEGVVLIQAPRPKVWEYLTDPQFVSNCAPGLRSMEVIEPDRLYKIEVSVGFGSMQVVFEGEVEWGERQPLEMAMVLVHAVASDSMVDVTSKMVLVDGEQPETTELNWEADIQVSGKIKAMASRMMGPISKQLSKIFFSCVRKHIEA